MWRSDQLDKPGCTVPSVFGGLGFVCRNADCRRHRFLPRSIVAEIWSFEMEGRSIDYYYYHYSSKLWSSHYKRNLCNCVWKPEKFRISTGFNVWTRDLATSVQHSNQLGYDATNIGSWSFVGPNEPEWLWNDTWNISYIELEMWNQVSYDPRSYRTHKWPTPNFSGFAAFIGFIQHRNSKIGRSSNRWNQTKSHPLTASVQNYCFKNPRILANRNRIIFLFLCV